MPDAPAPAAATRSHSMARMPGDSWLYFAWKSDAVQRPAQYDFALHADWTCVFGPSGSGKTTLLKLIAGLMPQAVGTCVLHGRELRTTPAHLRSIALVDQQASVFPHLSVRDNVAFARRRTGRGVDHTAEVVHMLEQFGLSELTQTRASLLSGGEAQRVCLARAVFTEPVALLLDETFSGLDRAWRVQLRSALRRMQAERAHAGRPMPIVSVSHDVGEVFAAADDVLRIEGGRVLAQGPPATVLTEERAALLRTLCGS